MDSKQITSHYLRSWRIESDGNKMVKNDLSSLRRTKTALATLLDGSGIADALEPHHKLALQAARSVLTEVERVLECVPGLVTAEQKKRRKERSMLALQAANEWLKNVPWGQSDEVAQAEEKLLDEFCSASGKEWVMSTKSEAKRVLLSDWRRSKELAQPYEEHAKLFSKRHRVALRFSRIEKDGTWDNSHSGERIYYCGLNDFDAWKAWRVEVSKAVASAMQAQH